MPKKKNKPIKVLNARLHADVYAAAEAAAEERGLSLTSLTERLLRKHVKMTLASTRPEESWALLALRAIKEKRGDAAWASTLLSIEASAKKANHSMGQEMRDDLETLKKGTESVARTGTDR